MRLLGRKKASKASLASLFLFLSALVSVAVGFFALLPDVVVGLHLLRNSYFVADLAVVARLLNLPRDG